MPVPRSRDKFIHALHLSLKDKTIEQTHRTAEEYAKLSGVPETELFPSGSLILNVGAPDNSINQEGVINVDRRVIVDEALPRADLKSQQVQAEFPVMPFKDQVFDRIVSSFSIGLYRPGFRDYFDHGLSDVEYNQEVLLEIDRLLKADGVAYIWPASILTDTAFREEAQRYCAEGGTVWAIQADGRQIEINETFDTNEFIFAELLIIFPKHALSESKQRVQELISSQITPAIIAAAKKKKNK